MSDHVFTLTTETLQVPLVVTRDALADFLEHGLGAMNEVLDHMAARRAHPSPEPDSAEMRKRLVADMMLEGLVNDNTRKLILCALWLSHHFPDITGLVKQGEAVRFVGPATPDEDETASSAARA